MAAVFPAPTTSALLPAAESVTAQGLVIGGSVLDGVQANPLPLAQAYGGDVVLRTLPGGASADLVEKFGRDGSSGSTALTARCIRRCERC